MRGPNLPNWVLIGGLISILVILIITYEYYNLGYVNSIEAAGGILFSGLLVLLYHRQAQILDRQEGLMEHQNQMMMESHRPQLKFHVSGFKPEEDVVTYEVENIGPGTAFDVGLELELDNKIKSRENPISYARPVNVGDTEPTSLGVVRASEKKKIDLKVHLPNPEIDGKPESLPVSNALSEFVFSEEIQGTIYIKALYSDVRGEEWGGQVIERASFIPEEVGSVQEIWGYGVDYLDLDDVPIEKDG